MVEDVLRRTAEGEGAAEVLRTAHYCGAAVGKASACAAGLGRSAQAVLEPPAARCGSGSFGADLGILFVVNGTEETR